MYSPQRRLSNEEDMWVFCCSLEKWRERARETVKRQGSVETRTDRELERRTSGYNGHRGTKPTERYAFGATETWNIRPWLSPFTRLGWWSPVLRASSSLSWCALCWKQCGCVLMSQRLYWNRHLLPVGISRCSIIDHQLNAHAARLVTQRV